MPAIVSDMDLPVVLNTPIEQVRWAKKLVEEHLGSPVKSIDKPPMQGLFSRTLFLTLEDGRQLAQQFRDEVLDVDAYNVAKKALGAVVPDATALKSDELEREEVWTYVMPRLPGQMWLHEVAGKGADGRIAINKSLGRVLSKGLLANDSAEAVETKVRPHLKAILASPLEQIHPWRGHAQKYLDKLDQFKALPLWVSHYDLNKVNILIDEDCEVTGLIDWELSAPLPFGVGLGRIHTIAGEYTEGKFRVPPEFEEAERGFWHELFEGMPADVRKSLESQASLVQDAVMLGSLLDTFSYLDGAVGCDGVRLDSFPKFLTYRVPLVRGEDPPYDDM